MTNRSSSLFRRFENEMLRHCLVRVVGWEGAPPDPTLCNADVLGAILRHYAGVLDDMAPAGVSGSHDLRLLGEFLTEPSGQTLGAIVDAIPGPRRTFTQPRGRSVPHLESMAPGNMAGAGGAELATPEEVLGFMREHADRCVVVMLSRGGGFTHTQIARKFGVSRSRCYRYEKWFESLPAAHRAGIIAVGFAAAERHRADDTAFEVTSRLIGSPEAEEIMAAQWERMAPHGDHARLSAQEDAPALPQRADEALGPSPWRSFTRKFLGPFHRPRSRYPGA